MKKFIYIILAIIIIQGCELYPEIDDHYLSNTEYNTLLSKLSAEPIIDKSVIDSNLIEMGVTASYEYSYYISGDYKCYSFLWSSYSTSNYSWNYYVDVDIWTEGGILNTGMCSYYTD